MLPKEDKAAVIPTDPDTVRRLDSDRPIEEKITKQLSYEEVQDATAGAQQAGVKALFDSKDIELKTEVDEREIIAINRLLFVGSRYRIDGMSEFVENLLKLKVSLHRRGRTEFVQGLHAEERRLLGRDMSPIGALLTRLK
jgi:hypothetical protein